MGRIGYVPLDLAVTSDSDQDIWELTTGTTIRIAIHGWELTSPIIAAEPVNLRLLRRTTAGDGGTAVEVLRDPGDAPIVGVMDTLALAPGAAGDILQEFEWEQLGPLGQLYTPEMRPIIVAGAAESMALNMQTALAGTTQWKGWVCWEEF